MVRMPKRIGDLTLYNLDELKEKLGVTKETLRLYSKNKKIKAQKLGTRWYISEKSLQEYFN